MLGLQATEQLQRLRAEFAQQAAADIRACAQELAAAQELMEEVGGQGAPGAGLLALQLAAACSSAGLLGGFWGALWRARVAALRPV